jgi:FkbM family methyltransferase
MGFKRLFNSVLGSTHYRLVNKNDYDRIFACKDAGVSAAEGVGHSVTDDLPRIVGAKPEAIFDVGANKGGTYSMFRSLFPQAPIYAFEPDPRVHAKLKDKAKGDPLAHLQQLAVSDRNEELEFHVTTASEMNSLLAPHQGSDEATTVLEKIKVQSVTLDDFTAKNGIARIDLLKMDIQGAEIRALDGASGLLGRFAIGCLYLELCFSSGYEGAPVATDIIAYLQDRNYKLSCLYNLQYEKDSPVLSYCDGLFVPGHSKSAI